MKLPFFTLLRQNRQIFLYCVIGSCGATLDFLIYSSLVKWGGGHYQFANAIGYACGTALSFMLNARFNFRTGDRLPLRFLSFISVATLGWASSAGILHVTVAQWSWNKYFAKLMTTFVVVTLQYNLNRLISFRKLPPTKN